MWNPDQDVDALIDRFLKAYYGNAAPLVRRYLDELYRAFGINGIDFPGAEHTPAYSGIYGENLPWLDDASLLRWSDLWRQAEQAVRDDAQRVQNVRMSALPVLYVRLKRAYERDYKTVWVTGNPKPHAEAMATLKPLAAELVKRQEEATARRRGFALAESGGRHRNLMKQFRELESWTVPAAASSSAVVTSDMMTSFGQLRSAVAFPIRLIACDSNSTYRVRARMRKKANVERKNGQVEDAYGFSGGLYVDYLPHAEGVQRKTYPRSSVSDQWTWQDLGEYDLAALQAIPLPTMNGLCLYVQGDVDVDKFEISKISDGK